MFRRSLVFMLLTVSFFVYSQNAKERIVILTLKPISVEKTTAEILTESLIASFVSINKYQIVERSQLDKILSELKLSNSDEFTDDMILDIGKLSKSKLVIIGSVGKLGSSYLLTIRTIEVETGNVIYADKVVVKTLDALLGGTDTIVNKIVAKELEAKSEEAKKIADLEKRKKAEEDALKKQSELEMEESKIRAKLEEQKRLEEEKQQAEAEKKRQKEEEQNRLFGSINNYNKGGIGLIVSGSILTVTGLVMCIADNLYYPDQKNAALNYDDYKILNDQDLALFTSSIVLMSIGGIMVCVSIPLLANKTNNLSFDVGYDKGLSFGLNYRF